MESHKIPWFQTTNQVFFEHEAKQSKVVEQVEQC